MSNRYWRFYQPIIDALREMGGSGNPSEVKRRVLAKVPLSEDELSRTLKSGENAVWNEIAWARSNLREVGLLDGATRGLWSLTQDGWSVDLSGNNAYEIHKKAHVLIGARRKDRLPSAVPTEPDANEIEVEQEAAGSPTLMEVILTLSPSGFERLCQLVLRKAGFSEVVVTGKSGDGGIDGHGILQVNALVSTRVLFQCKRYQGSIGAGEIRNFRGAMSGRSDQGLFITTSTFTSAAETEAHRDGVAQIELVDGERLTALMESLGIGVTPRTVYDVDERFFDAFR